MRVLAAAAAVAFVVCAQDRPGVGRIAGVVRDAATGQPIEGAPIFLNFQPQGRFTDQHGRYVLEKVPEASYVVAADERKEGRAIVVKGGTESRLDLLLTRVASIEGTVLDPDGRPANGAIIAVLEKSYEFGQSRYIPGATAVAGEDGKYRIQGITAGAPFVLLAGPAKSEASPTAGGALSPVGTYYPRSAALETAEEILLASGEVRSRMDIRRVALPTYCVSGVVRGAEKSAGIELTIRDRSGYTVRRDAKPGGEFQVCGLRRGTYQLNVLAQAATTGGPRSGASEVLAIDKADVTDLSLNLQEGRQIPCQTVSAEGRVASPNFVVTVAFRNHRRRRACAGAACRRIYLRAFRRFRNHDDRSGRRLREGYTCRR